MSLERITNSRHSPIHPLTRAKNVTGKSINSVVQLKLTSAFAYVLIFSLATAFTIPSQALAQSNNGNNGNRGNERNAEKRLEKRAERNIEKGLNKNIEKHIEKRAEKRAEKSIEKTVTQSLNSQLDKNNNGMGAIMSDPVARQAIFDATQHAPGKLISASASSKHKTKTNDQGLNAPSHQLIKDADGFYRIQNQWLLLTDKKTLSQLRRQGFDIVKTTRLKALGKILVEIKEPADKTLDQVSQINYQLLDKSAFDYNHLFAQQKGSKRTHITDKNASAWRPHEALTIDDQSPQSNAIKIGLIDSRVDASHPVFKHASLKTKSFVEDNLIEPNDHGTAVASILVGANKRYKGLLPQAKLYSASVFYYTPGIQQGASVKSLLIALDWLAGQNVSVINMSLAGPDNQLLKAAVESVTKQGITVVASVGNDGPTAAPKYPSAYKSVIAVTAINNKNKAYFKSNRGSHIDFSAPGVNILHASPDHDFDNSSGTSFAAPFVSALAAYIHTAYPKRDIYETLEKHVLDLGVKGADDIYGHGLVRVPD